MTGERKTAVRKDAEKITVAHVASGLVRGGSEMVIYRYISHIDPEKYCWIYISYTDPEESVKQMFETLGVTVFRVTSKRDNLLKSCWEVWRVFRENRVEIVHSHMTLMCFVTNLIGWAAGARVRISHSHLDIPGAGVRTPVNWFFKRLSTWTATARFACGEEAARYLFGKKGAKSAVIMNNALDYETFRFDAGIREKMRRKYGLKGCTVLGHVGRFHKQKNHSFLLEVFAGYRRQEENSRLVLIGDGPLLEQVKEQAKALGISERVMFVPPTGEVNCWYMAMDVLVFPSRYEGWPLVPIEAQIAGLPVVASPAVVPGQILSEKVRILPLTEGVSVWCRQIREAAAQGRGKDVYRKLAERNLLIEQEAKKLDHFYRQGTWG